MQQRDLTTARAGTPLVASLAIVVALGGLVQLLLGRMDGDAVDDLHLTVAGHWFLAGLAVAVVLLVERRPWSTLGTRRLTRTSWIWASALGAAQLLQTLLPTVPSRTRSLVEQLGPLDLLLILVTAAVTEEVLFRGFLQERLTLLLGRSWLAGVLAAVAFVLVHVPGYGWWGAVLAVGLGAVSLSVLYAVTHNTGLCALFHLALNAPVLVMAMAG